MRDLLGRLDRPGVRLHARQEEQEVHVLVRRADPAPVGLAQCLEAGPVVQKAGLLTTFAPLLSMSER